ncbi:hypothetical protein GGI07_000921 [Coemansia sp. Benny D115]|nr:hypothetical protein GGI07_000921 [Coemansia sp. Benny D115]
MAASAPKPSKKPHGGSGSNNTSSSSKNKKSVGKEFLCKVQYQNPLPELPFPPKLLPIPPTNVDAKAGSSIQARRQYYFEYRHTTLEEATPYPLYVDADYGMPIDPCLLGLFDDQPAQPATALDKEDEFLLSLPSAMEVLAVEEASGSQGVAGSGTQTPVSAGSKSAGKAKGPGATTNKRSFDHSVEGQLRAIEESFSFFSRFDAQPDGEQALLRSLRHPTNAKLHAVESIPLFPDDSIWANEYNIFSVDSCPDPEYARASGTQDASSGNELRELAKLAKDSMVFRSRVSVDHLNEQKEWFEGFLPEDADTARRVYERIQNGGALGPADDGVEYRFDNVCEYDVPPPAATSTQDYYMITFTEGPSRRAQYVPIKKRLMLKRRRVPATLRQEEALEDENHVTCLDLQLREFSEEEIQARSVAMNKLHEVIKEEIVHASPSARNGYSDEKVNVGGDPLFDSDDEDDHGMDRHGSRRRHRRTPSYSSSSPSR